MGNNLWNCSPLLTPPPLTVSEKGLSSKVTGKSELKGCGYRKHHYISLVILGAENSADTAPQQMGKSNSKQTYTKTSLVLWMTKNA